MTINSLISDDHAEDIFNTDASEFSSVAILMCTLQGIAYLHEQLDSICRQNHKLWSIWASDDGSDDGTLALLDRYKAEIGTCRVNVFHGPRQGFSANFLSLVCNSDIKAKYYAFADQDDIWESNKLTRALDWLGELPSHLPALYCSCTLNVDVNNVEIGLSRCYTKQPDFSNALVQSIGGGNTMLFNDAARQLLVTAGREVRVVSHDWWAYMLISGCGGRVIFDPLPSVRYRQHEKNLIGANSSWIAIFHRARLMVGGRFKMWNDINISALNSMRAHLTPENLIKFDTFSKARKSGFFLRLVGIKRSGVRRQTVLGNIGLIVACLINKI